MEKHVEMELEKGTKRTWVYQAEDEEAVCRQVYLAKSALPEVPPPTITLTVKWEVTK